MSYKIEVNTYSDGPDGWSTNALRFATEEETVSYSSDLSSRWTAVRVARVAESPDEVNAAWAQGHLIHLPNRGRNGAMG